MVKIQSGRRLVVYSGCAALLLAVATGVGTMGCGINIKFGPASDYFTPPKTCDGQMPTGMAAQFSYALEHSPTKCLVQQPVSFYANSKSDADACAEKKYSGTDFKIGQPSDVQNYFFSWYVPDGFGCYHCGTHQMVSLSSSSATTCMQSQCLNCTIRDITSMVTISPGVIDGTKLANWCDDNRCPKTPCPDNECK